MRHAFWWLPAVLFVAAACSGPADEVAEFAGRTMGTSYSVKIAPPPDRSGREGLGRLIEERLAAINREMSTYLADSDLMRFNASSSTDWQPTTAAIVELVERARGVSDASGGLYDITVGPLVNLWGFGSAGARDTPPAPGEIGALLPEIGYRHLQTRRDPPAMRKAVAGLQVDLSSIAKGWAVDQIAQLLAGRGFDNFLVEIGGEVYARGERHPGRPWRIAIEKPLEDRRAVLRAVALRDMAMATSGDYRNFFSSGGQRYSHTIDPRTGQAVQHRLAEVTVFAGTCTDADAWATALMALGEARGPALADAQGLVALFVERAPDGLRERPSAALQTAGLLSDHP